MTSRVKKCLILDIIAKDATHLLHMEPAWPVKAQTVEESFPTRGGHPGLKEHHYSPPLSPSTCISGTGWALERPCRVPRSMAWVLEALIRIPSSAKLSLVAGPSLQAPRCNTVSSIANNKNFPMTARLGLVHLFGSLGIIDIACHCRARRVLLDVVGNVSHIDTEQQGSQDGPLLGPPQFTDLGTELTRPILPGCLLLDR